MDVTGRGEPGNLAEVCSAAGTSIENGILAVQALSESAIIPCPVLFQKPGSDQQPKWKSPCLLEFTFL